MPVIVIHNIIWRKQKLHTKDRLFWFAGCRETNSLFLFFFSCFFFFLFPNKQELEPLCSCGWLVGSCSREKAQMWPEISERWLHTISTQWRMWLCDSGSNFRPLVLCSSAFKYLKCRSSKLSLVKVWMLLNNIWSYRSVFLQPFMLSFNHLRLVKMFPLLEWSRPFKMLLLLLLIQFC